MGLIYKATFSNGKSYIGQTTQTLQKRKQQHKDKSKLNNNAFYHAIKKYGWNDITWEVIEDNIETREQLNEREQYWISFYNTYKKGYNSTTGGDNFTAPHLFKTQEEIDDILNEFKETGNITDIAKKRGCGYNIIRQIVQGEIRQDISGIKDKTFFETYVKKGLVYTNSQIDEIILLNSQGKTNPEIEKITNIPIKYIQDVLSGRVLSGKTKIPHVTREERQKYNPVNSKLKKEEVLDIVNMHNNGFTLKQIAEKYNKDSNRIYEIVNGITWSSVTGIQYNKYLKTSETGEKVRKFCKEDILKIVELSKEGKSNTEISKIMNTTPQYIYNILSGRKWNSVTHIKKQ